MGGELRQCPKIAPSRSRPPAAQTLTFTHLSGFDEVSRCFEFTVGLVGPELDVEADALINRPLAIEAESGDPKRWFHGLVSEFRLVKLEERVASYEVVLRPWLWLLGLTHDCRIFQNLSVIEIVEEIFGKYPEAEFEKRLQKSLPAARILRAVRRERPRLRAAPAGARGHLLFLRVRRGRAHAGAGRRDRAS